MCQIVRGTKNVSADRTANTTGCASRNIVAAARTTATHTDSVPRSRVRWSLNGEKAGTHG